MDELSKKTFDFAADLTKQLITLSTGIVTVSLLFGDKFHYYLSAKVAFFFYTLSTIGGIWTLMALTGTLAAAGQPDSLSKLGKNVRIPSGFQIICFGIATFFTLLFVTLDYGSPLAQAVSPQPPAREVQPAH